MVKEIPKKTYYDYVYVVCWDFVDKLCIWPLYLLGIFRSLFCRPEAPSMTTSLPLDVATTVLANFFSSAERLRSELFRRLAAPVGEIPTCFIKWPIIGNSDFQCLALMATLN